MSHHYPGPYQTRGVNAILSRGLTDIAVPVRGSCVPRRLVLARSVAVRRIYFELYRDGALIATSPMLADVPPALTFLPSGYADLIDEVRVRCPTTCFGGGAFWMMDDVTFGAAPVLPSVTVTAIDATASAEGMETGSLHGSHGPAASTSLDLA